MAGARVFGAEIIGDNFNVTGSGSGFALGSGANSGINPPTTRLTGAAASGLRYMNTGTKATTAYTITSNKLRVTPAATPGRFVLSADGTTPFNFASALGTASATPTTPVVYDISISMDNDSAGILRFSFAIGTAEGDAFAWDFGFQVYRAASGNNFYTIGKRIDTASSGLGSDLNAAIHTMGANTYGTEITILMRVADAGAETSTYNSRIQLSLNGGSTWFYDTDTDADLASTGWRFDAAGRYFIWDVAPDAGNVTYDNFSVNWTSGPRAWTGAGPNGNWSSGANWGGVFPVSGSPLIFGGTTRQTNTNDISGLNVPWTILNNGGFAIYGNTFTNSSAITNVSGVNTIASGLAWSSTAAKSWRVASGSELILNNANSIEVNGDHTLSGGGTLRQLGSLNIGQTTTANPAFVISQGAHIVDGGTINSRGNYRIGTQTLLTNNATLALTTSGSHLHVGHAASASTSRLDLNNSTVTMAGGTLALPYAAGATSVVAQVGGTVSGGTISFSDAGAGAGTYTVQNGTLEAVQIKKTTGTGSASISFDNATLRTASGANSAFLTGLNSAQILSGGLMAEATSDVTIGQALIGTGALTKTGASKITLTGANTYSGNTIISTGTLALGVGGSIGSSPTIIIANSTTLDVSAISFSLGSSQTIVRNATSGSASVNGSMTLSSGSQISLQANGTSSTVGTLAVTGNLTLNGNTIAINVAGNSLALGTYTLLTYTGTKSGSFNATPTITGSGLPMGLAARIVETAGTISLKVYLPAYGIPAANINVVEHDLANTTESVTVTATTSLNGFQIRDGSSRGDYLVQIGSSSTDDLTTGAIITSVAQNGRDHGEESGINYCTAGLATSGSGYFIPTANAPAGKEYNINVSAAFFPYNKFVAGYARNSSGTAGGANNLLTASAGVTLGTHFVDNSGGISTINLAGLGINSQTDGVLLVTAGFNDDNFASSKANADGTWTVYIKDNGTNGAVFEQGPVAFAFIPKSNVSVISGKFHGDGSILMYNDTTPRFSVTNFSDGQWRLTIPGYGPANGVLIVSPEGGDGANQDNIMSYQASGNTWIIQSRDIPGNGLQTVGTPLASFVFIPGLVATLSSPANDSTISSSPTLRVNTSNSVPGTLTVTFFGHEAPKPGPGKDFMIAVLPDTQNYAREASGSGNATKEMWFAQTDWIVDNRVSENIAYVATLGDCVQNADSSTQWRNATNAMYRLEHQANTLLLDGIPYGITVGNHDQDPAGDPDGSTALYNLYFGTSHFSSRSYYGGHFQSNNDSWFDFFSAGGMDFIVFSFEYGRYGSTILDWANDVLATNQNRRVIVLTHHAGDDTPSDSTPSPFSAQGSAIYNSLKSNPNFFLMMGGHVFNEGGEGRRSDTFNGKTVRTLISDYQGRFNGGNGLMRLMYFSPSNNLVSVKTFSPYTGNFETDANSQFTFSYNMQPNGAGTAGTAYAPIKTNLNVVPGSQSSHVWTGLSASKPYEWYVTLATEEGDYATSPEWKFNTSSGFSRPAPGDEDGNGLPDSWEAAYGITDPNADADGDGQSNLAEYVARTNPTNAASAFRITRVEREPDGQFTLTWSSVGGVRYRVQYSDDATLGFVDLERSASEETDDSPTGSTSKQSFTDSSTPVGERFYRVTIVE